MQYLNVGGLRVLISLAFTPTEGTIDLNSNPLLTELNVSDGTPEMLDLLHNPVLTDCFVREIALRRSM